MTIEALFSCAPTLALLTLSVFMAQGMWRMAQPPHSLRPREALHESPRRVHLRTRAVCRVANPRDSWGYRCGLRLAAHPDPQRPLAARFVQSFPNAQAHPAQGRIFL